MRVTSTALPEVLLVEPRVAADARGWFMETWNAERYGATGIAHSGQSMSCGLKAEEEGNPGAAPDFRKLSNFRRSARQA